jgi:hypothetical protein
MRTDFGVSLGGYKQSGHVGGTGTLTVSANGTTEMKYSARAASHSL